MRFTFFPCRLGSEVDEDTALWDDNLPIGFRVNRKHARVPPIPRRHFFEHVNMETYKHMNM